MNILLCINQLRKNGNQILNVHVVHTSWMKLRTVACDLLVLLCAQPQSAVSPTPPGQDLSLTAHHPHMPAATGDRNHIQTTSNKIHSLYFY